MDIALGWKGDQRGSQRSGWVRARGDIGVTEERLKGQEGVGVPDSSHGASSHVEMNAEYEHEI